MRRVFTAFTIVLITLLFDRFFSGDLHPDLTKMTGVSGLTFVIFGIIVGSIYWVKFGASYSHLDPQAKKRRGFSLYNSIPGKKYINFCLLKIWKLIEKTFVGRYLKDIYSDPVESEQVLGGFFFGKAMIITAIAFYNVDPARLILILCFSAAFDSLTGVFQQTLMNFFHKTVFKSRALVLVQNFTKRYILDVFRAEVITLFLMDFGMFAFSEQFHILKNRLVSSSYYFNAIIIDRLVEMGVISRNFRARFVIYASTGGGMLCLLDFAKTEFPSWVPPEIIASIPQWMPGPLKLLALFNFTVFVISGSAYLFAIAKKKKVAVPSIVPVLSVVTEKVRKII